MTTIAEKIAQSFGNNYGLFSSPESGNLVDVCAHQAIKNVEEFGKRKFVFTDDSAIGMGDGQWFVGYADCFCNAGVGHHPQCPGSQKPPPQPTAPPPAAPKQEASVSPFTIHILGKENRKVAVDGSQH
ncbi:MAG TPA: hypothetical protein HPQ00_14685, partial [Magnetococcales bacterium]|nr:hypothetical protein [Magnetococcales bacterium]